MAFRSLAFLLALVFIGVFTLSSHAQDENEDETRGTFLSTRPSKTPAPNTKSTTTQNNEKSVGKSGKHTKSPNSKSTEKGSKDNNAETALGLGYTLYLRNNEGQAVRVDPTREFHTGDALRITIEPNIDGYLYIFHTENDGKPQLLFPDYRLHRGNNAVTAHVPYEVPSSQDPVPNYRWFVFKDNPAIEHLYFVVRREPLPNVPISEDLVNYCLNKKGECPFHPDDNTWSMVKSSSTTQLAISKRKDVGEMQSSVEQDSISRGLGLSKDAPPPTIVYMSRSLGADLLVVPVSLNHK